MTENSSSSEADNFHKIFPVPFLGLTSNEVSFSPSKHKFNGTYKWISDVSSSEESETAKIMKDHDLLKNIETIDCTIDNGSYRNRNQASQKESKAKEIQNDFIKVEQLSYWEDQSLHAEPNRKDKITDDPKNILTEINLNEKHSETTSDREEGELSPDFSSRSLRIKTSYPLNESKVFKTEFQQLQNSAEKEFELSQTNEAFVMAVLRKEVPDSAGLKYFTQHTKQKIFGTIKSGSKKYIFRRNDLKMPSSTLVADEKFNSSWSKKKQNVENNFKILNDEVKVLNYLESSTEQSNESDKKNAFSNDSCTKIEMKNETTKTPHKFKKSNSLTPKKLSNQSCLDKKGFFHPHQKLLREMHPKSHADTSKKFIRRKSKMNKTHLQEQERENKEISRTIEKNRVQTLFQRQMNIINQCVIPQKGINQVTPKENDKLCKRDRKWDFQIEQKFEEWTKNLKKKEIQTLEDMEQFLQFLRTNKEQNCSIKCENIQIKDKTINKDEISVQKCDNAVKRCLQTNAIEKCNNFGIPNNNFVRSEIGETNKTNYEFRKLRGEDGSRKSQFLNSKELNNLNPNNIKYFASPKKEKNIIENKQSGQKAENGVFTNNKSAKKSEKPNIIHRAQYSFNKEQNKKCIQTENLTGGNKLCVSVDINRKMKDKMKKIGNKPNAISSSERNRRQKSLIKGLKLENTFILVDEKLGIIDSKFYLTKKGNQFYLKRALPKERIKLNGKRKQNPAENCSQSKGSVIRTSAETRGEFHCDRKIAETTLEEMESFLRQLRLRKKLISESSRFDSESHACRVTLLDSFRAERKAKLMACMPDNPKKTARLLKDLEKRGGQPKVLSEVELRKQELIQILRAETDAIIFANKSLSGWERAIVSTSAADVGRRSNVTDKKNESERNKSIAFTWKKLRLENKNMAHFEDEGRKSNVSTESQRILNAMKTRLKSKKMECNF